MTAKRGMQWKTPWRRQKPALAQAPTEMWFFNNFQVDGAGRVWYQQALDTPTIGDTDGGSFWIGMIAATGPEGQVFGPHVERSDNPPNSQDWQLVDQLLAPADPAQMAAFGLSNGAAFANTNTLVSSLGVIPPVLRAIVSLMVVEDLGDGTRRQTLWVDGAIQVREIFASPYNATAARFGTALPGDGYLNSWAGGNAVPTDAEVRTWFSASRYASPMPAAQEIPGKTLDRFNAGAVPGATPSPLLNLAAGQNMILGSEGAPPVAANTLFSASFAY